MHFAKWCAPLLSVVLLGSAVALAEDAAPSTQPSESKETKVVKAGRWGFAPYNRLSELTDEQKTKIMEIHRKAQAERKAISEREESDILALLTDEQKSELDKLAADKKAKEAEKRIAKKDGEADSEKDKK